jgi:hypothetical protein
VGYLRDISDSDHTDGFAADLAGACVGMVAVH